MANIFSLGCKPVIAVCLIIDAAFFAFTLTSSIIQRYGVNRQVWPRNAFVVVWWGYIYLVFFARC
jgi:hypothetical protein